MIRCYMDLVPEDSECAKCCIYCKKDCEFRCEICKECKIEKEIFEADCVYAYEE